MNIFSIADAQIQLQRKILDPLFQEMKPDVDFLLSLADLIGSKWPSLAESLALSADEIEVLKENEVGLSHAELALRMLGVWMSKEEATYGQLCHKLKIIQNFQ